MAIKDTMIGQSGVVHYGSRSRVEDEWHPNLRGRAWVRVAKEMHDNDSIIGGSMNVIGTTVRQVPWHAKEADGSDEAKEWAVFLNQCMEDMSTETPWDSIVCDAVSSLVFGFAPFEIVHKLRSGPKLDKREASRFSDGLIGWRGVFMRSQDSMQEWAWDSEGCAVGMWQMVESVMPSPVFIPMDKMVNFRFVPNRGSPEGRSLLRNIYRSWFFLKRLQELEVIGIERDLVGLPVVRVPISLFEAAKGAVQNQEKATQLTRFQKMVQQIRRNEHEGLVFPHSKTPDGKETGYDISLLSTGGSRTISIGDSIKRLQKEIGINFNTQFQQLGVETTGSQSLSSDMTSQFALGCGAVLKMIQEQFAPVVDELMALNGVPPELRPQWVHGDIEKQDMQKLSDALSKLIGAGILSPDDELEGYVRAELGWPARAVAEGGEEEAAPTERLENPALAIQYLSLALERARAGGNEQLAVSIGQAIDSILGQLPGAK